MNDQTDADDNALTNKILEKDIVVVGCGMVGLAAMLGFAKQGWSVLGVDYADVPKLATDEIAQVSTMQKHDIRSTALSLGSTLILKELGAWNTLEPKATQISSIHVSQLGNMGTTLLDSQELGEDALGFVAPNAAITQSLLEASQTLNIERLGNTKIQRIQPLQHGQRITLLMDEKADSAVERESVQTIECKLLVIADGAQSETAKKLGIGYDIQHFDQHALVSNIVTEHDHQGRAYERFTPDGPLAMLPVGERLMSLVWTGSPEQISQRIALSDQAFLAELQDTFGDRLGRLVDLGPRGKFPLVRSMAKELIRRHTILLGNAAQALHPVAGQGFNLALRGVAEALTLTNAAQKNDLPIGSLENLNQLNKRFLKDRKTTIQLTDQLAQLFTQKSPTPSLLRSLGLVSLDNVSGAKKQFARQTMGLANGLVNRA